MREIRFTGNHFTLLLTLFFIINIPVASHGEELNAQALAQQIFDRERGDDSSANMQMVLISSKGKKKSRKFNAIRAREDSLERQLLRFTEPADIEGTSFLAIEKPGWETDQFLYLPALRRSRRIVSSQQGQRFVNSDFTYEDMRRHPVDDYHYQLGSDQACGKWQCYQLVAMPKDGVDSQYSKTVSLVEKESLTPVSIELYDKKDKHWKTYKVHDLQKIQGIWTEMVVSMEDLNKEHKTF